MSTACPSMASNSIGCFSFAKHPEGPLQIRQPGMRNGDALAYPRRSQLFPLEKAGRDLIDRQAETGRGLGREFLQQQPLVRGPNVDHDVRWRQQIGDFHGRSMRAHR